VAKAIQARRKDKARRCVEAAPDDRPQSPQPGPAAINDKVSARTRLIPSSRERTAGSEL